MAYILNIKIRTLSRELKAKIAKDWHLKYSKIVRKREITILE